MTALNNPVNPDQSNNQDSKDAGAAGVVFDNNKLTSDQVEGLTDTSDLQDTSNTENVAKNPENALQEEGSERERAAQLNDGSSGNQTIRNAVEQLNTDELIHNLEDGDSDGNDHSKPAANPTPFVSPD